MSIIVLSKICLVFFPIGEDSGSNFSRHVRIWSSKWMQDDVYIFIVELSIKCRSTFTGKLDITLSRLTVFWFG